MLGEGLQVYWDTYHRLSKSRGWSQGEPQAITVAECFGFCDGLGWRDPEFKLQMLDYVQDMDEVLIQHISEKNAAAAQVKPALSEVVTK